MTGGSRGIEEVALSYPAEWVSDPHPGRATFARETERWLVERGIVRDEETAVRFRSLSVGLYGGWPFPRGERERALVITKFLTLWIFYDDLFEESDDGLHHEVADAIVGLPSRRPADAHPHVLAWWELGEASAAPMSAAWRERHRARFADWLTSVREEAVAAKGLREGRTRSASEHLAARARNIGYLPTVDFVEYVLGEELSPAVRADARLARLERTAAELVAMVNDLVGFSKDRRKRWPNLVDLIARDAAVSTEQAFHELASLHQRKVDEIAALGTELVAAHPSERASVANWLRGVQNTLSGFARWHAVAARYSAIHDVAPGRAVWLRVGPDDDTTSVAA